MDLSESMQGAGGVGGLLAVNDGTASFYPTFGGNGNVSEYLDSTGAVQAHYEYDAFGKEIVAATSGSQAQAFSHRFSTKPLDAETGLYYYGYNRSEAEIDRSRAICPQGGEAIKYYDSTTGRWLSRDPVEEKGGPNLYAFIGNDGVNSIDVYGLFEVDTSGVKEEAEVVDGSVRKGAIAIAVINEKIDCDCICKKKGVWVVKCTVTTSSKITLDKSKDPVGIGRNGVKFDDGKPQNIGWDQIRGHEQRHIISRNELIEDAAKEERQKQAPSQNNYRDCISNNKNKMKNAATKGDNHEGDNPSNGSSPKNRVGYAPS